MSPRGPPPSEPAEIAHRESWRRPRQPRRGILPPMQERTPERPQRKNSATCRPSADRWLPPPKFPHHGAHSSPDDQGGGTSPRQRPRASPWLLGRNSATSSSTHGIAASRWPATARKTTATRNAVTDRSLAKIARRAPERVSGVPKEIFRLRSKEGPRRGPSARIWARPERPQDEAVGAGTCPVRTTCLSCGEAVRSATAAAVNDLPEDEGEDRILVVHDGCQGALVRSPPCLSASVPDAAGATERPSSAADEHGPSGTPRATGAALPQPAGNPSNVHPAARCPPTAKTRRPPRPDRTPPRISAPRGPGQPCRSPTRKTPPEGPEAVSVAPARNPAMCTSRPPITKATIIYGKEPEAKA